MRICLCYNNALERATCGCCVRVTRETETVYVVKQHVSELTEGGTNVITLQAPFTYYGAKVRCVFGTSSSSDRSSRATKSLPSVLYADTPVLAAEVQCSLFPFPPQHQNGGRVHTHVCRFLYLSTS